LVFEIASAHQIHAHVQMRRGLEGVVKIDQKWIIQSSKESPFLHHLRDLSILVRNLNERRHTHTSRHPIESIIFMKEKKTNRKKQPKTKHLRKLTRYFGIVFIANTCPVSFKITAFTFPNAPLPTTRSTSKLCKMTGCTSIAKNCLYEVNNGEV
jgi:hypothetical protein